MLIRAQGSDLSLMEGLLLVGVQVPIQGTLEEAGDSRGNTDIAGIVEATRLYYRNGNSPISC